MVLGLRGYRHFAPKGASRVETLKVNERSLFLEPGFAPAERNVYSPENKK